MEIKKQDKKEVKTQPRANLPVVSLNEKEMSAVQGGWYWPPAHTGPVTDY